MLSFYWIETIFFVHCIRCNQFLGFNINSKIFTNTRNPIELKQQTKKHLRPISLDVFLFQWSLYAEKENIILYFQSTIAKPVDFYRWKYLLNRLAMTTSTEQYYPTNAMILLMPGYFSWGHIQCFSFSRFFFLFISSFFPIQLQWTGRRIHSMLICAWVFNTLEQLIMR